MNVSESVFQTDGEYWWYNPAVSDQQFGPFATLEEADDDFAAASAITQRMD